MQHVDEGWVATCRRLAVRLQFARDQTAGFMKGKNEIAGYRILAKMGAGAASQLYAVQDPKSKQVYALKQVLKRTDRDLSSAKPLPTWAWAIALALGLSGLVWVALSTWRRHLIDPPPEPRPLARLIGRTTGGSQRQEQQQHRANDEGQLHHLRCPLL